MMRKPMRHLRWITVVGSASGGRVIRPRTADAQGKSAKCLQWERMAWTSRSLPSTRRRAERDDDERMDAWQRRRTGDPAVGERALLCARWLRAAPRQVQNDAAQLGNGDAALHADDLDSDETAACVHVNQQPILHLAGAGGTCVLELDIQGIRLGIVTDLHEDRSCQ